MWGKSAKKAGNTRFLTELGIDRLYPEPKSNFLPFGSPKSPKRKSKTQENIKIPDVDDRIKDFDVKTLDLTSSYEQILVIIPIRISKIIVLPISKPIRNNITHPWALGPLGSGPGLGLRVCYIVTQGY